MTLTSLWYFMAVWEVQAIRNNTLKINTNNCSNVVNTSPWFKLKMLTYQRDFHIIEMNRA